MKHLVFALLLTASGTTFAREPKIKLASHPLSDQKPASHLTPDTYRPSDYSNATLALADPFSGSALVARQSCDPGRYLCADLSGCCRDDENCVPGGCCDKPKVSCGADACYDPDTQTCCQDKPGESHAATIFVMTQTARSAALMALSATTPTNALKLQVNVVRAVAAIVDQQSATTRVPPFVAQMAMMRGLVTRTRNAAISPRVAITVRRRSAVILVLAAMMRPAVSMSVAARIKGAV
ncbi:hypothetical protein FQN50_002569 [Emmonsiellopsis sp. PD_5]|nr:hypothetical protein FQN50_002569 [Emmonsiellopsis sp. PD_5]